MKRYLFFLSVFFPALFWSQIEIIDEPVPPPNKYYPYGGSDIQVVEEDFYNEDGTFRRLANRRVVAEGFHVNKVLDGKFKEYDLKGNVTRICTYRLGKLHGEEIQYDAFNASIIKQFDNGDQVAYEIEENPGRHDYSRVGPYFTGTKKEPFVFTRTSSFLAHDKKGNTLLREDSIFFVPNKPVEIHTWMFTKTNDYIRDTLTHDESFLLDISKPEYSVEDVREIDYNELIKRFTLTSGKSENREVYSYYKSGNLKEKKVENYRLTYYPNELLKDSILTELNHLPYYHYRNDSLGTSLFHSRLEYLDEQKRIRKLTFDYLKNGNVYYTITSVGSFPEKVTSSNDSIQKCIQKGEFVDYYGTHYLTKPDGMIDTSFSKLLYPFRYQDKLNAGKYYFLPYKTSKQVLVLEITGDKASTYTENLETGVKSENKTVLKYVTQNGNRYYLNPPVITSVNALRLMVENGKIYNIDWNVNKSFHLVNTAPHIVNIDDWAVYISTDTLVTFRSPVLTEEQYLKAKKLKSISKLPRKEFNEILEEIHIVHDQQRSALEELPDQVKSGIGIDSRVLWEKIYNHGYNPYFSEKEFPLLMESYHLTKEEERAIKKILRL